MRFFWLHRIAVAFQVAVTGLGLTLLPGSVTARAQGIITGSITGSVVDQTGAVIPGASVIAVSESTGTTLQGISNGQGIFQIVDVPLGSYTITISASGFGPSKVSHVQVVAGNATSIGSRALKLGSAAQTVEVEGDAAQPVDTTNLRRWKPRLTASRLHPRP